MSVTDPFRNAPKVIKDSAEWDSIDFLLSLALPASCEGHLNSANNITNPHLSSNFNVVNSARHSIYAWIKTDDIPDLNTIYVKNFDLAPKGKIFNTGVLPAQDIQVGSSNQYVLCKIALSRPYAIEAATCGYAVSSQGIIHNNSILNPVIPEGYDSIVFVTEDLHSRVEKISKDTPIGSLSNIPPGHDLSGAPVSEIPFENYEKCTSYIIDNADQVLPLYLIDFGVTLANDRKKRVCESCAQRDATVYCKSDHAYFCNRCDAQFHSSHHLASKHERIPVSCSAEEAHRFCKSHPSQLIEYYCPKCSVGVCVQCKMVGSHSSGEAATHRLVTISEAFSLVQQRASEVERDMSAQVGRAREKLGLQLKIVDEKLREIYRNSNAVEEELFSILQKALASLQHQTEIKLSGLLGVEADIQRQLNILNSIETRFVHITDGDVISSPAEIIHRFTAAERVSKQEVIGGINQDFDGKYEIADLSVQGTLKVTSSTPQDRAPSATDLNTPADIQMSMNQPFNTTLFGRKRRHSRNSSNNVQSHTPEAPQLSTFTHSIDAMTVSPRRRMSVSMDRDAQISSARQSSETNRFSLPPALNANSSYISSTPQYMPSTPSRTPAPIARPNMGEFSLTANAEERRARMTTAGVTLTAQPFADSRILSRRQAMLLYFSIPYELGATTNFVWSMTRHGRSIETLHLLANSNGSSVVVIKRGDQIFGGFASAAWNSDGKGFGGKKCFLFNINKDLRIPFIGSVPLYGTPDSIRFGLNDLVISDDFTNCTDEIENDYGIGFEKGSYDAKILLSGVEGPWSADDIEVWNFILE